VSNRIIVQTYALFDINVHTVLKNVSITVIAILGAHP